MENQQKDLKTTILEIISEYLGVSVEDINETDSFASDLHMKPSDLTDLVEGLPEKGVDVEKIDLTKIHTVGDLIEAITDEEL